MARTALAVLLFLALPARAEVTVTVAGERVNLRAVAAPLNEVLDQLARRTGMKVVYEGGQPRQPVTLTLESRTPAEAVMAVLEGQGINFGLRTDASGARVERLLVASGGGGAAAGPAAAPGRPTAAGAPPPPPMPDFEPDEEVETKEEAPDEAAEPPAPQPPAQAPPGLPTPRTPTFFNSPFAPQPPPQIVAPPAPPAPTVPEDEEKQP